MRRNFGDHSANERTYLAWIRTSIGLMAFGFLLEKFTLFLDYLRLALNQPATMQEPATRLIGLAFLTLGAIMIGMAALRYRLYARQIDSPELEKSNFVLFDTILGACLAGAGILLGLYLALRIAL
jgi:putative membrane protein